MMSLRRLLDRALASVVYESPDPFATEVALVANGVVALLAFFAAWLAAGLAAGTSAVLALALLVGLRAAFVHRWTTVVAGALSALGIGLGCGAAGWIMGQLAETAYVPELCAAITAVLGGALPASAYVRLLRIASTSSTPSRPSTPSRTSLVPSTR